MEKIDLEKLDLDIKYKGIFIVGEGNLVKFRYRNWMISWIFIVEFRRKRVYFDENNLGKV